jgi:carboxymethylenebutenolidase
MTEGQVVKLEQLERELLAYQALPEEDGPWPGVVVIQEWWGLDDHIRSIANRFAVEGFAAIAPDLYYGVVTSEPDEARKQRMALDWDHALAVIQGSIDYLVALDHVEPKSVGVTGFCMGGGLTWHAASKLRHVGAAVPFYGGGPEMSDEEVAGIKVPVLAIFGELDRGVSPEVAARRAAQMDRAGVSHQTVIYPGAEHAFFNDTRRAYHSQAAASAWQKMCKLFREVLV